MGWATKHIERLLNGETIQIRPKGNSMTGRIESGQLCTIKPYKNQELEKGDIVLCKVKGNQYLHLITAIRDGGIFVQISNNKGYVNGWINRTSIYGICTKVEN